VILIFLRPPPRFRELTLTRFVFFQLRRRTSSRLRRRVLGSSRSSVGVQATRGSAVEARRFRSSDRTGEDPFEGFVSACESSFLVF